MRLKNISEIELSNQDNVSENVYLTFDIDWASDEVLNYTLDILEENNSCATFFVTHETILLNRIRGNSNFELGIHPNFNFLLNGSHEKGSDYKEVIQKLMDIVPEAKSVRSHSMTQSSYILEAFKEFGLSHDCNHFISVISEIELKPWMLWNGLIRCPYFWEDDVHYTEKDDYSIEQLLQRNGLKIFDFHPIHVYLNTEDAKRYEISRAYHRNFNQLNKFRFKGYGTENILLEIIEYSK